MINIKGSKYGTTMSLASASVLLNFWLLFYMFVANNKTELGWTTRAALEAESVALISCSGHGRAYLDGLVVDENPACECNSCYSGPSCSNFIPDCVADADGGDPLFLEPFWMDHAASSAVLVAGWHRMSYFFPESSFICKELDKHIRILHALVGNAITDGKFIVLGAGSTQLLNAAVHALSPHNSSSPSRVAVSIPFYPAYREQTDFFDSVDYKYYGDTAMWKNTTSDSSANIIEFVTSPNNPDCHLKTAVLQGQSVKTVFDHAYYWPHFSAIPSPANEDLMLFSLSKLTGHAGTRFGWALVKDEAVYKKMVQYTFQNTFAVARDTQLRALKLLKAVISERGGREMFNYGYKTMRRRWEELNETLSLSKRFSLQEIQPQYCNFFQQSRGPSPAYAWLKCEREEDLDCYNILRDAGIIGRRGELFGSEKRYVRLSLIKRQDDFDILSQRLLKLVSKDDATIAAS